MTTGSSAAVVAGLLGKTPVVFEPWRTTGAIALPAPLAGVAPFVVGAAVGAVVGGVAYVIMSRLDEQDELDPESRTGDSRPAAEDEPARAWGQEPRPTVSVGESQPARAARHMAASGRAGVPHTARHFRTKDWEQTGTILVQDVSDAPVGSHAAPAGSAARPIASRSSTDDYADVAEAYVSGVNLARRMATAARGVASVLGERLGGNMMDGIPMIRRADGTVADVGTAWWDAAVEASGLDSVEIGSAREAIAQPDEIRYIPKVASVDDTAPQELTSRPEPRPAQTFSESAARRLASIDMSKFPERRSAEELDEKQDVWAAALEALDEKASDPLDLIFMDDIGDVDTLDEPEGLEMPTDFIPFRAPAGHPEVVDTDSYVDYLIRQEFTKNSSSAVRRNAREYLHVIEGGTAGMLGGVEAGVGRHARRRGKHFKQEPLPLALEA